MSVSSAAVRRGGMHEALRSRVHAACSGALKSRDRSDKLSINLDVLMRTAGNHQCAETTPAPARSARSGIVSSSHLVSPRSVELSELEFGLIVAWNAFSRWAVRCMAAAGCADLTITDVLLLHHVNHRARNKKLADICFVLNYEDTHVVAYSLKKLVAAGLAETHKQGKEVFYSPTPQGETVVRHYREVREDCLVGSLDAELNADIGELARLLRTMSGLYDQAARAATLAVTAHRSWRADARHAFRTVPGDVGRADSYAMPVRLRASTARRRSAWCATTMPTLLQPFIDAAQATGARRRRGDHHQLRLPGAVPARRCRPRCRCRCGRRACCCCPSCAAPGRRHRRRDGAGRRRTCAPPARRADTPVEGLASRAAACSARCSTTCRGLDAAAAELDVAGRAQQRLLARHPEVADAGARMHQPAALRARRLQRATGAAGPPPAVRSCSAALGRQAERPSHRAPLAVLDRPRRHLHRHRRPRARRRAARRTSC